MQAEGIRKGDRHDFLDGQGRRVSALSWTALADAEVSEDGTAVYVLQEFGDGRQMRNTYALGAQVALSFGVGRPEAVSEAVDDELEAEDEGTAWNHPETAVEAESEEDWAQVARRSEAEQHATDELVARRSANHLASAYEKLSVPEIAALTAKLRDEALRDALTAIEEADALWGKPADEVIRGMLSRA